MATDEAMLKWLEMNSLAPEDIQSRVLGIFSPPGFGKTVLASLIGERTLIITDELAGATSLTNHAQLKGKIRVVPFSKHETTRHVLRLAEDEQFRHFDDQPFDVAVLDTVSGMVSKEIQSIVAKNVTKAARVSPESAGQPDYMVSEQRMMEVMDEVANFQRMTTVLLFHTRIGDKLTPGDLTRPDVHAAAFRVVNKYSSVIAYYDIAKGGQRRLQVMPNGNGVSVKTRYHFPSEFVTPEEFVQHIRKWQNQTSER